MRIPLYRTQAAPTNEAPGQPIRARMSMEPFVNEALSKGAVAGEALKQMGEFARMRYEMATQEKLDNALLRAEEELRTTAREMESRNMVGNVLDGDKPLWNQSISDMRNRLQSELGRDRKANAIFNERFGQMELTQRFALRGAIDAKMERQIAAAREQRLTQAENDIANGTDIATLNLALGQVGVDSARLGQLGLGNPDALTRQEYELLKRGTARAAMSWIDAQDMPLSAASKLQEAVAEKDPSKVTDTRSLYVYNLMEKLSVEDRVAILSKINGISEFLDGPTLEQERIAVQSRQAATDVGKTISSNIDLLADGGDVPDEQIAQIGATIESVSGTITPEAAQSLSQSYSSLVELRALTKEVRPLNQSQLDSVIQSIGQPENESQKTALEFLTRYRDNRNRGLKEDPMGWAFESGYTKQSTIDLSPDAINNGTTNVEQRIATGQNLRAQFNLDYVPVLTNAEVADVSGRLLSEDPMRAVTSLTDFRAIMGPGGSHAVEQLRRAGLPLEYVIAMDIQDPALRQNVATLASTSFKELSDQVEQTSVRDMDAKVREMLAPYMSAYLEGGDGQAVKMLNEEVEIARKIAVSQVARRGMDPLKAAEYAVENFFPEYDRVVQNSHGNFIVPQQFDVDDVDNLTEQLLDPDSLRAAGIEPLSGASFFLPGEAATEISEEIAEDITSSIEMGVSLAALSDNGVWLNNGQGDGVVLHYNLNGQYLPVRLKTGGFYDVKFSEIGALASRLAPVEEQVEVIAP